MLDIFLCVEQHNSELFRFTQRPPMVDIKVDAVELCRSAGAAVASFLEDPESAEGQQG